MRTISPQEGRKGSDESPVRLNGVGIRNVQACIPVASVETHVEPGESDGWIGEISRVWARGPENTLELAKLLHRARRSVEHGQWSRLWRSERVPFSKRKAEMLVVVGQGLGEANANKCAHLPSNWRTLYYVVQLGPELAERLIIQSRIHPRLQLRQAREFLTDFKPESAKKSSVSSPLERRLDRFSAFIQRQLFRAELKRFLRIVPSKPNKLMNNPNSHEHIEFA